MPTFKLRMAMRQWKAETVEAREGLARQSIQELAKRIVENTPVDTGFLRGSWQPSIEKMIVNTGTRAPKGLRTALKGAHTPEARGAAASGYVGPKVAGVVLGMKLGDKFYMSNNAAYAMRIEYGFRGEDSLGRKYRQLGTLFVTGTIGQWPSIVREIAPTLGFKAVD